MTRHAFFAGFLLLDGLLLAGTVGCASPQGRSRSNTSVSDWSQDGLTGRQIKTEHFDIISTLTDRAFEDGLPNFLERAFERYESTLPTSEKPLERMQVYLFACRPQWELFTQRRYPAGWSTYHHIRAGGFTEGSTAVLFFTDRAATLATLAHEGWHQYVHAVGIRAMPPWLHEGLACYHEAVQCGNAGPVFTPQANGYRIGHLRDAVQRDRLLSIHELVSTDAGEAVRKDNSTIVQTYYSQVWALVTFLRHGAGARRAAEFEHMMSDLADGKFAARVSAAQLVASRNGGGSAEAIFAAYFGCTPEQLEKSYYDHLVRVTGY